MSFANASGTSRAAKWPPLIIVLWINCKYLSLSIESDWYAISLTNLAHALGTSTGILKRKKVNYLS